MTATAMRARKALIEKMRANFAILSPDFKMPDYAADFIDMIENAVENDLPGTQGKVRADLKRKINEVIDACHKHLGRSIYNHV